MAHSVTRQTRRKRRLENAPARLTSQSAAIALVFKAIVIPVGLHRIIQRLGIHRDIDAAVGIGPTMLADRKAASSSASFFFAATTWRSLT